MDYRQRRKEQAQQTEQAILQAAMELARENSFDKVSVRDICQRAGITTGAFYHHFRSKEDLLSRGFSPLDRHMEEALSGHETDAPPQRLWLILSTYASFIEAQGWELVARYYQRRLDAPDDASSMDPTRYTLRAMLDCLRQAEEEGSLLPGWSVEWTAVGRASEAVYKPSYWRIRREGSCERLPRRAIRSTTAACGGTWCGDEPSGFPFALDQPTF